MLEEFLSTFVGIFPKVPAFWEFRLEISFWISDSGISLKLKLDSNNTVLSINLITAWPLYFSIATLTPSIHHLDIIFVFMLELASHSFIPNFSTALSK